MMPSDGKGGGMYAANLMALTGLSVVKGLLTAPDFSACRQEAAVLAGEVSKLCHGCIRDACRGDLDVPLVEAELAAIRERACHDDLATLRDRFISEMRLHLHRCSARSC